MANNGAHNTVTTEPLDRATPDVSLSVAGVAGVAPPNYTGDAFFDDFENGYAQETELFKWGSQVRASVSSEQALSGNQSLEFAYQATPLVEGNSPASWAEQRFELKQNMTELWIQHDLYIPANHALRHVFDGSNYYAGGWKQMTVWADQYSTLGKPILIYGALRQGRDADGPVAQDDKAYLDGTITTRNPETNVRRYFQVPRVTAPPIIDPAVDSGHWQRRTYHYKMPTSELSNDGVVEVWLQKNVEMETPLAIEKLVDIHNGNFYGGDSNYINRGYILGYVNEGYDEQTSYYVDNFALGPTAVSIGREDLV